MYPIIVLSVFAVLSSALPNTKPFHALKRQVARTTNATQVDLGYEIYQGSSNASTGLNTFLGIRFAAAPVGSLRWQAPQPPTSNRSSVLQATSYGPSCPQSPFGGGQGGIIPGSTEDCLFLNVYSPSNATNLPVLVWIHGGGYGQGNGQVDMANLINANQNGFVGVSIHGAFGFLSSDEVFRNGVVNAGLLDQHFALQWVQAYIQSFGGDPDRVTISGISAGAGSVMLQDIAYGGTLGTSLFVNSISTSPYLPQQYGYKDWIPSQSYYAFAAAAGCPPTWAYGNSSQPIFDCLISQDTEILQQASYTISGSGTPGSWAFLPVTDGVFLQSTPSQALLERKVNGLNHLSGNNAEEGAYFTAHNITTEDTLLSFLKLVFPLFTEDDLAKLLYYYQTSNSTGPDDLPRFATAGDDGLTAINVSQVASGQQQRANNIYAEATFVCPSYWLAEAYSKAGGAGYKYQYSVPNAAHGVDSYAYFGPPGPNLGPDFILAFQRIWGQFIINGNPSISSSIANGASSNMTAAAAVELEDWPPFMPSDYRMVNLNQTGGTEFNVDFAAAGFPGLNVTEYGGSGLRNNLKLVDAYSWEGGRGLRCDYWRSVAAIVPE